MAEIIPGILEKDFTEIERKVSLVAPYVEWVQIDFADGTLVPTLTNWEFPKFTDLIKPYLANGHKLSFEAHLMVASPEKYIKPLADAGFRRLIAHVESNDARLFLEQVQFESVEAGLALDGSSALEELEPFLEDIDVALIMGAEAGASGQDLQLENVEKIKLLRENLPDLPIEVDQGVNPTTAKVLKDAGATRLVTTSFIFKNTDPSKVAEAIENLKEG